ncbi:glycerol-3-phosphate cytidylyltransferase [Bacillus sp. SCS-151]|uniref:glycerol-3-phosphate cytidylyltransferase n=1 Tax=Nanhaiella sioensis TaxID=3115293 RepID=UPI003979BA95
MKKIITYGTFDLLHWGHVNLLKRASELGDNLTVGLSTDEFNKMKNKQSYHNFENRKKVIEAIRYVDKVIPEKNWEQKADDIITHNVDIFVMGDDWKGKFDYLEDYCHVIYLPRTKSISTTMIKKNMELFTE